MACAAPPTKETTNYARLCRLLVDVGTQALRDTFNNVISPANLQATLAANKTTLQTLRARRIINPTQWGKLFPAITSSVSSITFDISLLMVLLRNLCGLAAPASGWDVLPPATDVSLEADIARVKYYRNTVFAHVEHASVDNATFKRYWSEIRDTLVRLGGVLYQAAVDNLEKECMDPDVEEHYKELLCQWKKDEDNIKDELKEISTDIQTLTKKIDDLVESTLTSKNETSAEGQNLNLPMLLDTSVKCGQKNHDNELLQWFCEHCNVCICAKCGQTRHSDHTKVDIDQAAEQWKDSIAEIADEMKSQITNFQVHVERSKEKTTESQLKIAKARNKALSSLEELMQVLREHETRTTAELDLIERKELRGCATQLEHFQTSINHLQTSVEHCEAILHRNKSVEILQVHQDLIQRCRGLLHTEKLNLNKPLHTPSHTRYQINEELVDSVRREVPGRVVVSKTDPLLSLAEGKVLEEGDIATEAQFVIKTRDSNGKPCYDEDDQITVKVQSPSGGGLKQNVTCHEDGTYHATYTPDCVGQHDVEIEINGQKLTDSPWRVKVSPHFYKYWMSFGSPGEAEGRFDWPRGIATDDKTGNIAVADCNNNRVQIFSSEGKYLKTVSAKQLIEPRSVAFTSTGDLKVIALDEIFCFNERTKLVSNITNKHLTKPHRLFIARDGRMLVCDRGDNIVKVLSPDGTQLLRTISDPDRACPFFAICHQELFIVSYPLAHNVKVFSKEGVLLNSIGTPGCGVGQLNYPVGLAIDRLSNLVVCDRGSRRLQIFTLDGKLVSEIIDINLHWPYSAAVSATGHLFVTDERRNCVHVFY